jgi:glycosyltransferase involved in cell wall biosynthesis
MNILFLSGQLHPHGGGAELASHLYANLLNDLDFKVLVMTNRFSGEPEHSRERNQTIYRLPLFKEKESAKYSMLMRFDFLFSSPMRKALKWADLVYIPSPWYSAIPIAKAYRKPVIVHLHDYVPICPLSNLYDVSRNSVCERNHSCSARCIYAFERVENKPFAQVLASVGLNSTLGYCFGRLVGLSDAVIFVSKEQRRIVLERLPLLGSKSHLVYNPIPSVPKRELGGDDFGYFGGTSFMKGIGALCEAMISIKRAGHESIVVHATKFSEISETLGKYLSSIGILPHGKLNSDEYRRLYERVRTVVVPSLWPEPWPYVVVEAICQGRFLIASRTGGMPEQVAGSRNALLCEPGEVGQLVDALKYARNLDREAVHNLGMEFRESFLKKFNNETSIKDFVKVCESVL